MTKQEAEKVLNILFSADGGCEYCVAELIKLFCNKFPEFQKLAKEKFSNTFGKNIKEE